MSRGSPRETLSKDDIRTLGQVRRDIWSNAMMGGGFGMGSGLVLHTGAQWARRYGLFKAKLDRNTAMLSILGGGALGMFVFAARTGKQVVHNLHPIFQNGAVPKGDLDYQRTLEKARERGIDKREPDQGHGLSDAHGGSWDAGLSSDRDDLDRNKLEQIRVVRRKSLMDNLEKGRGLSDSHGGHWVAQGKK